MILAKKGTYAVVMHLAKTRAIQIGEFGEFTFLRGWYVYLGSAHGAGGLKARTDHHKLAEKPKSWHIDSLRDVMPIAEIWFSYTQGNAEHAWAQVLSGTVGATVPAPGVGSRDCDKGCRSHLIRFDQRPATALFRAGLFKRDPKQPPVYVEFVESATETLRGAAKADSPLLAAYFRGRRFLEERRAAAMPEPISRPVTAAASLTYVSRDPVGREIIERLAAETRLPVNALKYDAQFTEAVETVVANCGARAFGALFEPERPQARKAIMMISRTADTRQSYRIEGVKNGCFRSVAPQSDDPVFDTVAFKEVPSRLCRARGSLLKLQELLLCGVDRDVTRECHRLVKLCLQSARQLRRFVNSMSPAEEAIPEGLSRKAISLVLYCRKVEGKAVGKGRAALHLIVKNVWDFLEMQRRGLTASPKELRRTLDELETIEATAKAIMSS